MEEALDRNVWRTHFTWSAAIHSDDYDGLNMTEECFFQLC